MIEAVGTAMFWIVAFVIAFILLCVGVALLPVLIPVGILVVVVLYANEQDRQTRHRGAWDACTREASAIKDVAIRVRARDECVTTRIAR